ncbi:hypothetical protein GCM10023317_63890 [Actinopolymorpha pittospori]
MQGAREGDAVHVADAAPSEAPTVAAVDLGRRPTIERRRAPAITGAGLLLASPACARTKNNLQVAAYAPEAEVKHRRQRGVQDPFTGLPTR